MSEIREGNKETKRGFLVPGKVIEKARKSGIPLADLQLMVRHSTRVTSTLGNRRYHNVYFMVEGNKIMDLHVGVEEVDIQTDHSSLKIEQDKKRYDCSFCNDTKKIRAFDECGYCEGVGCKFCDEGLVPSNIPCPMCVNRSVLSKRVI